MAAISFKCPNCGGDLRFDPATQKYKCAYCFSDFSQEELERANPQAAAGGSENVAPKAGDGAAEKTAGEQADEKGAQVYSCPSCGAEIVADATTAATFCYYCHNPVVLQGRLSGEYEPDLIIPFAVDKKEAVDSFLSYVKSKKFVPRDFFCKEQIEKISGVYFPFWMYSCQVQGTWQGTGNKVRTYITGDTECAETKVYDVERQTQMEFDRLTRNALNRENRQLVEAVQPFRLEETKAFSMGYLSGFLAEKRDIEKSQFQDEIRREVRRHSEQMLRSSLSEYTGLQTGDEDIAVHGETWKYLLLPVWVLTYKGRDGKLYYYAMNGQTRKVAGLLPIASRRVAALFCSVFAAVFALFLAGGYFL